ncbi:7823_t:CDS:2 [Diversispora eburnea]|uniref:7823_t:CDS:1 n=1 Tax=Diversispora eburnea TaxID=1213867 RepID=A0A9N8ZED6_9GLOM|nr:7823_t:CDS:2 [Diversispora eburnea]
MHSDSEYCEQNITNILNTEHSEHLQSSETEHANELFGIHSLIRCLNNDRW